jgi:hypothetical protein
LIRDVFSGSQDYRSLKRRLWDQFGITLLEFARSFLHSGTLARATNPAPREPQP